MKKVESGEPRRAIAYGQTCVGPPDTTFFIFSPVPFCPSRCAEEVTLFKAPAIPWRKFTVRPAVEP
jgi:hypothetical protein